MAFKGERLDKFNRAGTLGAIFIMSSFDAQALVSQISESPDAMFEAIKDKNGGPSKRFDGTPVSVRLSNSVEILPTVSTADNRASYASKLHEKMNSSPFPPGYKPW